MFTVHVDRATRTLKITVEGFWDLKTVEDYERAVGEARAELAKTPGRVYWRIDGRNVDIQSQDVAERIQAMIANGSPTDDDVVALIFPAGLGVMQAKRVASSSLPRTFTSIEEAETWLMQQRAANPRSA